MQKLGVTNGSQVLLPTYHCPTMISPAVALGAEVIFYPLNETGAPDIEWLEKNMGSRITVLLMAHFFGIPQSISTIRRWCDQHNIFLIEDCAHAIFGSIEEDRIGSIGDIAIGSLPKFFPVLEGGFWISNNPKIVPPSLKAIPASSQIKSAANMIDEGARFSRLAGLNTLFRILFCSIRLIRKILFKSLLRPTPKQSHNNYNIDVNLAKSKLTTLSRWICIMSARQKIIDTRQKNYRLLAYELSGNDNYKPLFSKIPASCAPYVFPLWVESPDPGYLKLRSIGLPVSRWDRLWSNVPMIERDFGMDWSHHVLQIACHQDLSDADIFRIAKTIKEIYS